MNANYAGKIVKMEAKTTPKPESSRPDKSLAIVVLLVGVTGGLIVSIAFIFFCKNCFKKRQTLSTQPPSRSPHRAEKGYEILQGSAVTSPVPADLSRFLPQHDLDNNNSNLAPDFAAVVNGEKDVLFAQDNVRLVMTAEEDKLTPLTRLLMSDEKTADVLNETMGDDDLFPQAKAIAAAAATADVETAITEEKEQLPSASFRIEVESQSTAAAGRQRAHSATVYLEAQEKEQQQQQFYLQANNEEEEEALRRSSFDDRLRPGTGRKLPSTADAIASAYYARRYDSKYREEGGGAGGESQPADVVEQQPRLLPHSHQPVLEKNSPPSKPRKQTSSPLPTGRRDPYGYAPKPTAAIYQRGHRNSASWDVGPSADVTASQTRWMYPKHHRFAYSNAERGDEKAAVAASSAAVSSTVQPSPVAGAGPHRRRTDSPTSQDEYDALNTFYREMQTAVFKSRLSDFEVSTTSSSSDSRRQELERRRQQQQTALERLDHVHRQLVRLDRYDDRTPIAYLQQQQQQQQQAASRSFEESALGLTSSLRLTAGAQQQQQQKAHSFECASCQRDVQKRANAQSALLSFSPAKLLQRQKRHVIEDELSDLHLEEDASAEHLKKACQSLWRLRSSFGDSVVTVEEQEEGEGIEEDDVDEEEEEEENLESVVDELTDGGASSCSVCPPATAERSGAGQQSNQTSLDEEGSCCTTSFESNTEPNLPSQDYWLCHRPSGASFLEPPRLSSEARRQKYRNLFALRQGELEEQQGGTNGAAGGKNSIENSFESFGTYSSESSFPVYGGRRPPVIATNAASFDSNASSNFEEQSDSTVDSQGRKKNFAESKKDSGYKSQSTEAQHQQHQQQQQQQQVAVSLDRQRFYFEAVKQQQQETAGRTGPEEAVVTSGDSFDSSHQLPPVPPPINAHVARMRRRQEGPFFGSSPSCRAGTTSRDFTIDSKSDTIFREFVRYDPRLDRRRTSRRSQQQTCSPPPPSPSAPRYSENGLTANIPLIRFPDEQSELAAVSSG